MRILYLATDVFAKGGIQRYSRAQITTLRQLTSDEDVRTLVLVPPGSDPIEMPFQVDYIGKGRSFWGRLLLIIQTIKIFILYKPDVVWSNHIRLLPIAHILRILNLRLRTVVNVYGREIWSGLRRLEAGALKNTEVIVSDCHFTADYVHRNLGVEESRIEVIWDPVDVQRFTPRDTDEKTFSEHGIPFLQDACYLMTLGRITKSSRHKGYDRMLDFMGTIRRADVIYLLVGDGDDRSRLEQRVLEEGLHETVYFLGSVHEEDLVNVYNAADIFVLVSDRGPGRGEGVPLTPLEAAACGKPIIVGDEDGSKEAVIEGVNGHIVSPRDPEALRRVILSLVDDPAKRKRMGEKARSRVEDKFSYQVFKQHHADLLKRVSK